MSIMFRSAAFSFNSMRSNSARLFRRSSLRGSIAAPVRRTFSTKRFNPDTYGYLHNREYMRLVVNNFPPASIISAGRAMTKKHKANHVEFAAIVAMYDIIPFVKEFRLRDVVAKLAANNAEIQAEFAEIATKNAANAPKDKYNLLLAEISVMNLKHAVKIAEIAAKYAANAAKAKYVASMTIVTFFGCTLGWKLGEQLTHFDWKTLLQSWS